MNLFLKKKVIISKSFKWKKKVVLSLKKWKNRLIVSLIEQVPFARGANMNQTWKHSDVSFQSRVTAVY